MHPAAVMLRDDTRPGVIEQRVACDGEVSTVLPAPASMSDQLFVIVPEHSTTVPFGPCDWAQIHGETLPAQGAACVVVFDEREVPVVVWWEGAYKAPKVPSFVMPPATGVDQSTAIAAVLAEAEAAGGGRVIFGPGEYVYGSLAFGTSSTTYPLIIEGQGPATRMRPKAGTGRMLTISTKTGSGACELRDFAFGCKPGTPEHFPYTEPFIEVVNQEEMLTVTNVTGFTEGTGTMFRLTNSYNCSFRNFQLRAGRYAVGWELEAETGANQLDTFVFDNCGIEGCYPMIFRGVKEGLHNITFNGLKLVCPETDRGVQEEAFMSASAIVGATEIELATEAEAKKYETPGTPVMVGYGENAEANYVESRAAKKLKLKQKLRYAHTITAGEGKKYNGQVLSHGVGISIDRATAVSWTTCQFEGYGTAVMGREGQGWTFHNCTQTSAVTLRVMGGLQDVTFNAMAVGGALGASELEKNILVFVPPALETEGAGTPARFWLNGPFVEYGKLSTAKEKFTPFEDASNYLGKAGLTVLTTRTATGSATTVYPPKLIRYVESGKASEPLEEVKNEGGGGTYYKRTYGGTVETQGSLGLWGVAAPGSKPATIKPEAVTVKEAMERVDKVLKEYGMTA